MPSKKNTYDLIVIGSGSGHKAAYFAAHELGWKVALVEEGKMGGTCLNRGCIPSKILIESANVMRTIQNSKAFGIDAKVKRVRFKSVIQRSNDYIDPSSASIEKSTKKDSKTDLYKGHAHFLNEDEIAVGKQILAAKRFLIATGCRPHITPIEGIHEVPYLTSTEALRLQRQPKSLVIIGGGYIAAELGHFFGSLGTDVSIIERAPRLLDREDKDISKSFTDQFKNKHKLYLRSTATAVKKLRKGIQVAVKTPSGTKKIRAEALLLATGVVPNTDTLDLHNAGVTLDKKGFVLVNTALRTNKKHIWALGDVIGRQLFKHAANYEAEIIKHNWSSKTQKRVDYSVMPHAVFSSPEVASVGQTEQALRKKKLNYEVRRYHYADVAKGKALEEEQGFVKFLITAKGKILGCHILGPHASILIHEVVVAMNAPGNQMELMKKSIHIHPALNEVVWWALTRT